MQLNYTLVLFFSVLSYKTNLIPPLAYFSVHYCPNCHSLLKSQLVFCTKSTLFFTPNCISCLSFSETAGKVIIAPGKLQFLRLPIVASFSTTAERVLLSRISLTSSKKFPSAMTILSPTLTEMVRSG